MLISTRRAPDGALLETRLEIVDDALFLYEAAPEEAHPTLLPLTLAALRAVFARYGKPLETTIPKEAWVGEALALPEGLSLRAFRFMNFGDVYQTDYLLLTNAAELVEVAAPSPLIGAALRALAHAFQAKAKG